MRAVDSTALSLLLVPSAAAMTADGVLIRHGRERMEYLVDQISKANERILIPTPSLSEIMVKLDVSRIDELLKKLKVSPWFKVESFDAAAAVELAVRTSAAIASGDKREGIQADYTKVKFDRQIVAIAMVNHVTELISDDRGVAAVGERWGLKVTSVNDLPLPPQLVPPPLLAQLDDL